MKSKGNFTYLLITLMVLLVSNVYFATVAQQERRAQITHTKERRVAYEEHIGQVQAWLAREQRVINGALDSYHADAYNSNVERIAEQQLIAAEYQLLLLQVLARQNAEMIELMMVAP